MAFVDWFWSNVDRSGGPDACWPWTGRRGEKGYGRVAIGTTQPRSTTRATHVAYFLEFGAWPDEDKPIVLHTCDNPPCCNPRHLRLGTHAENNEDMVAKNRHRPHARVTAEMAAEMRSLHDAGHTFIAIAERFSVHRSTVSKTVRGLT